MMNYIITIVGAGTATLIANTTITFYRDYKYNNYLKAKEKQNDRVLAIAVKQIIEENKNVECQFKDTYRKAKEMRRQVQERVNELKKDK